MKNIYLSPKIARNTGIAAAGLLLAAEISACSAVSAGKTLVGGNPTPPPKNPYSAGEQAVISSDIPLLMQSIGGLAAYKQAMAPSISPGVGNQAYCATSFDVLASDVTPGGNGLSASFEFEVDTPVGNDGTCPTPSASNVERISVGIDLANSTKYRVNLDNSFIGTGDPNGQVLSTGLPETFIPEDNAAQALDAMKNAVSAAGAQAPIIGGGLEDQFKAVMPK